MTISEKIKQAREAAKKGSNYLKLEQGRNEVRIVPREYDGSPWMRFDQHFVDGEYLKCRGSECSICAEGWAAYRANGKKTSPEISKLLPSQKVMLNVIHNGEHRIFTTSLNQLENEIAKLPDADSLFEWETGKTLIINKTGDGLKTRYSYAIGNDYPLSEVEIVSTINLEKIVDEMKETV